MRRSFCQWKTSTLEILPWGLSWRNSVTEDACFSFAQSEWRNSLGKYSEKDRDESNYDYWVKKSARTAKGPQMEKLLQGKIQRAKNFRDWKHNGPNHLHGLVEQFHASIILSFRLNTVQECNDRTRFHLLKSWRRSCSGWCIVCLRRSCSSCSHA